MEVLNQRRVFRKSVARSAISYNIKHKTNKMKTAEKANKRNEDQLPDTLQNTLYQLVSNLGKTMDGIKCYGDISDLGSEIGYAVGNVIKGMTEQETTDFIHGIRHGISLTNGTH